MNPFTHPLSPFFRAFVPAAFALTLGGIGLAEARPAWSVTIGLGKSTVQTGHAPKPWTGSGESGFDAQASLIEAEAALRGPWAVGARLGGEVEDTDSWPLSRTVRNVGSATVYAKRILILKGPFDLSVRGGLGYQKIRTEYIKVKGPPLNVDPPIRPTDEIESSPTAILGLSQRFFYYAAGLTVNESVEVSAHALSLRVEFGIPLGWHKR
jgi:hypothetical protein